MTMRVWCFCCLMLAGSVWAQGGGSGTPAQLRPPHTLVLGRPDAPVRITEFSSLTCPHCALFHQSVLPELKKRYIDTGKVCLECRDYPDHDVAMNATMLVHCAESPEQALRVREALFATQTRWLLQKDTWEQMAKIAAPLLPVKPEACLANIALYEGIAVQVLSDYKRYDITHTPSFMIGTTVYPKALTMPELDTILGGGDPGIKTARTVSIKQNPGHP